MERHNKIVDFLIIGAARSGTTSLFAYLRAHPGIFLPLEKEVCFFSDNDRYERGYDWYLKNYFPNSIRQNKVIGEATPAYMLFEYVPERIFIASPATKLIAILRNPILRAYSHYRFARRLKIENRSFNDAINLLADRGTVSDDMIGSQNLEYLMFGEYGRILKNYLRFFPHDQIKVVFFEDLKKDPSGLMESIYEFLGVTPELCPEDFKKRHNVGGEVRFESILRFQKWIKANENFKNFLLKIFPPNFLGAIDMWLTRGGNLKPVEDHGPDNESRKLLKEFYADDVLLLKELLKLKIPWAEYDTKSP